MKKDPKLQEEARAQFFEYGRKLGTREVFLDYVWNVVFGSSFGYSFSQIHSYSYSITALQELNLNYFYPRVYWNCACLSVEAMGLKDNEDGSNKATTTDYGEIARAIYKMKQSGIEVQAPSINQSKADFTPVEENNTILFGLTGIAGINPAIAQEIINKRPYTSLEDFCNKQIYQGSLLTNSKIIMLIKAGCFDEFNKDRVAVMQSYFDIVCPQKQSLSLANILEIYRLKLPIPKQLTAPYNFKKYVCSPKFFYGNHPNFKSKKIYWLDNRAMQFFNNNCVSQLQEGTDWFTEDGYTLVVDKALDKLFKEATDNLKEYINRPEFIQQYNEVKRKDLLESMESTDPNHWSFEACSFYSNDHELAYIDFSKYNVSLFKDLPEEPRFVTRSRGAREWRQFELSRIAGTVLARNDSHHTVTLLDAGCNVVQCKFDASSFAFYKQQISVDKEDGSKSIIDQSWLKRGQTLMLCGVRMGDDEFKVKKYKNSVYNHKVQKICSVNTSNDIEVQSYRYGFGEEE